MKYILLPLLIISYCSLFSQTSDSLLKQEKHFANIKQLSFGGDNAEAYFSPDSKKICFQSNNAAWGLKCDQIFKMQLDDNTIQKNTKPQMISSGNGRTTCSYYMPNNKDILYATTEGESKNCPPTPVSHGKYLWPVYSSFDIVVANEKGTIIKKLTDTLGYDAEATVSPKGDKIVFTSTRSGDLELWTMDIDGKNLNQVTFGLGYDGGAFFSPDGTKLVFRASRPQSTEEINEYKSLLDSGLVAPTTMEIYTCNVDGTDLKQITHLGKANWAPYFHPSGNKIIFSSNHHSTKGYDFQLFIINIDGTGLEQLTFSSIFNAFPMFSPNGKQLIFSSNRNNGGNRDTNLFLVDWVD